MKIDSKISHASVKVFINDILHIHFMRDKFVGLQSWQYETESLYYIEITLSNGVITCDYDRRDLWIAVLSELMKAR